MGDVPVHEAPTEQWASARQLLIESGFVLLLTVLLAVMGPFGTFQTGEWPVRLAYWSRTLLVGYLLFRPGLALGSVAARRLRFPEPAGWAAAVLVLSLPMSLWLWFFGPTVDLDRARPTAAQFIETYAQIAFVAALAAAGLWWLSSSAHRSAQDAAHHLVPEAPVGAGGFAGPTIGAQLADRLPPHLGCDVLALQMEDHYVRVHTAKGSTLVLMRLGDAVAELSGIAGLQVHRSWWVARNAVQEVERNSRTILLRLVNGLQVPVARNRLPQVKAQGWLNAT